MQYMKSAHLNFDYYEPDAYGRFITNTEGKRIVQLNPQLSNTESLAREGLDKKYPQFFDSPWYKRISEHTKKIMPELRPQWKAFLKGDMETFNKLASKQDLDFAATHKNVKDFIKYINDEQETVARAMASNIGDYAGLPSKWNLDQLKIFFSDDGVESLRKNVWNIAGPGILFGQFDFLPQKKENK